MWSESVEELAAPGVSLKARISGALQSSTTRRRFLHFFFSSTDKVQTTSPFREFWWGRGRSCLSIPRRAHRVVEFPSRAPSLLSDLSRAEILPFHAVNLKFIGSRLVFLPRVQSILALSAVVLGHVTFQVPEVGNRDEAVERRLAPAWWILMKSFFPPKRPRMKLGHCRTVILRNNPCGWMAFLSIPFLLLVVGICWPGSMALSGYQGYL